VQFLQSLLIAMGQKTGLAARRADFHSEAELVTSLLLLHFPILLVLLLFRMVLICPVFASLSLLLI
jgi:hypothetical protein